MKPTCEEVLYDFLYDCHLADLDVPSKELLDRYMAEFPEYAEELHFHAFAIALEKAFLPEDDSDVEPMSPEDSPAVQRAVERYFRECERLAKKLN